MKRIFIALVLLLFASSELFAQKMYMVSVGVADYPGRQNDLNLTVNDAKTMKNLYQKNNNAEAVLITNKKVTRQNVLATIGQTFALAKSDDIILFFFSGHGMQGGFCGYDGDITYDEVISQMARSKARSKMIIADACFSGAIRDNKRDTSPIKPTDFEVMLFLSSRTDEVSYEFGGMDNGAFTTYLEKALRGNADKNRDRTITAKELFMFVSKNVAEMTDDKQHPVMWGKFRDDMPVIVW